MRYEHAHIYAVQINWGNFFADTKLKEQKQRRLKFSAMADVH